jgi:hypothetical protein
MGTNDVEGGWVGAARQQGARLRAGGVAAGRPTPQEAGLLAVALAAVGVAADWIIPANYIVSIFYAAPLLLAAWVPDRRFLWGLAAALAALDLARLAWGAAPLATASREVLAVNRMLAAGQTLLVAALVHLLIAARQVTDRQRRALEGQRDELEQANRELGQREEEIVRQNEELQSQAEELERQSEELRHTNEELAGREKMLGQLLELSRSLTPELSRDDTLQRICEALGLLAGSLPIAVLLKQGDELEVICHHGFGPEGARADRLPFADSFSSLVMARGQTGYL